MNNNYNKTNNLLQSLAVIGTDTGVGKTLISALIVKKYQECGFNSLPFKPIVTGSSIVEKQIIWADLSFLAKTTNSNIEDIGMYKFNKAISPHLAAQEEQINIDTEKIGEKIRRLEQNYDNLIIEGIGGAIVPINKNETYLDLLELINLPVILVTHPNLGTINHTLLTVEVCRQKNINITGLIVNKFPTSPTEAQKNNPRELEKLTGIPLIGVIPNIAGLSIEKLQSPDLNKYLKYIDLQKITSIKKTVDNYEKAGLADEQYVWHPFTPMSEYFEENPKPPMIIKAHGSYLFDENNKKYLDGTSSLWVNVHGHRKKELDDALRTQLNKVAHTTLLGLSNEPSALLAEKLVEITPKGLNKVFYSDSGSTAMEIAVKVVFQYFKQINKPEKKEFVSFKNAYHGDTIGSVSIGGINLFHSIYKPLLFKTHLVNSAYCYRCPVKRSAVRGQLSALSSQSSAINHQPSTINHQLISKPPECKLACLKELENLLKDRANYIAAVVLEPKVQGAAGIITQPSGYIRKVADLCKKHDVLLIADEVATGFGRTAKMFACQHEDVEPDVMAIAKGITGGYLPLAATLFSDKIYNAFLGASEELKTFFHGHTYTGNPLACAVAIENLKLIDSEFLANVKRKSNLLKELLKPIADLDNVGEVRQCAMMIGIEIVANKETKKTFNSSEKVAKRIILRAREKGLIIRPLGDVIVLMPPLVISEAELSELVNITTSAISEITEIMERL